MAVKFFYWFLLWNLLCFCIKDVACFCTVTCTTDYSDYLECACTGVSPPRSLLLEAKCSTFQDGRLDMVQDRCEVHPPRYSCQMHPDKFYLVALVETNCTVAVRESHDGPSVARGGQSASWLLGNIVKTLPPFNVRMTRDAESVNVTWEIDNYMNGCLRYRVRLRDPTKQDRSFDETNQYLLMSSSSLLPNTRYQADVQASLCPEVGAYEGPWSAWSPTIDIMGDTTVAGGEARLLLYVSIAAFFFSMGLCYLSKPFCLKKIQFITFIPDPTPFFKPLHHKYDGNFKDWVRPMFSEAEVLMVSPTPVPVSDQKQPEPIDIVLVHPDSPCFFGHLSLDMVVLSGDQKEPELDGGTGPGEVGLGGPTEPCNSPASTSKLAPPFGVDPEANSARVLLASYRWCEPWDDDMDLDTVDSGFGESDCSSPVGSEAASEEEPGGAGFFTQEDGVKSNYVRQ